MQELKQQVLEKLKVRLNDTIAMMEAPNNRQFVRDSVFLALEDVVGADNVRAYGIQFRGDDFEIYAANSGED